MPLEGSFEVRGGWVVRALARDVNWPLHVAAGFIGNLGYESNEFRWLQERGVSTTGGYGWAQWTGMSGPYPRRYNFETWCAQHNLSPSSDEGNYGFILFELLDGSMKGSNFVAFANRMRSFDTIEQACHYTHEWYERPQEVLDGLFTSGPKRLAYAKRALAGALQAGVHVGEPSPGMVVPPASENPVELIKAAQRIIGAEPDGIPGDETRRKLREWQAERRI